jgi:glycosyltransferase involved in cell wall biosynthesis
LPGKPLVSVVTVVFNGGSRLEQAIRSVLSQNYDNMEFIIIDGGSTDGTLDIVRRYENRIDRWISEPDRGIYDAMNKGITLSSGELIGFLNSDDWYEPGAIAAVAGAYSSAAGGNVVIAGAWNLVFEDIDLVVRAIPSLKFHLGMPLSHQAMFVPRVVYDSFGVHDLRYRYAADMEMALRLHANKVPFHFLDSVLVNFRTSGASERHSKESGREASEIARRHLPPASYCLFRILRIKFEMLNFLSHEVERFLGKSVAGSMKKVYYHLKSRWSGNWRIP